MKLWGYCALYPLWLRLNQTDAADLRQCCHTCAVLGFFINRLLKINNEIKAENRRNRARKYINIFYAVFHSKVGWSFPLIMKINCVVFYLRSAKLTPSQLTRRYHGYLLRVWWNWGWSSSQQCCQTHECLFLRLRRQKPPVTSCINWPLDKYLYFYLLPYDWQCVSWPENLGRSMCSFLR